MSPAASNKPSILLLYSLPRAAKALIRSTIRMAMAVMISDGFTPPVVGKHRSDAYPEVRDVPRPAIGIRPYPCRAGQVVGVALWAEDIFGARGLQARLQLAERMLNQRLRCRPSYR